jgi:hypothetical protein
MPVTVRSPGWAKNPPTSAWNVRKVGAVKQGRNPLSRSASEHGRLMVGIGGNPFAREEPPMLPGAAWPGKPWSAKVTIVDPTTGAVPMGPTTSRSAQRPNARSPWPAATWRPRSGSSPSLRARCCRVRTSPHDPAAQRPPGAIRATPSRPARQPLAGARIGRLPARGSMQGRHRGATPRATALAKPRRACSVSGRAASGRAVRRGYLMPTTIDSGPARCSTQVRRKPACRSHCWHCAPV